MYDNNVLLNYLKDRRYSTCISILKNKIIKSIILEIQKKDITYTFTTISSLISASNFYLGDSTISLMLETALMQDSEPEKIEYLLNICEEYKIK